MENDRKRTGRMGEEEVCRYLIRLGHSILDRNWRSGHLEIDIVSLDRNGIHFVEVKSRVAPAMASPELNAGGAKMQRIARAAGKWLEKKKDDAGLGNCEVWFDVASVLFDGGEAKIEYFPGAYVPLYY